MKKGALVVLTKEAYLDDEPTACPYPEFLEPGMMTGLVGFYIQQARIHTWTHAPGPSDLHDIYIPKLSGAFPFFTREFHELK